MSLAIGPETRVGALLEAYPEVERLLVEMAPAFAKLRNPVVWRTVAKVATLEQAAKIGAVSLQAMIRRIRDFTGGSEADLPSPQPGQQAGAEASWLMKGRVVEEIDADAMLERGDHPIGKVREAVRTLGPGDVVVLRSSFRPEPLLETMRRSGASVGCATRGTTHFSYFGRSPR
jgi:hypothetical protein